jgi:hypothetical protein
MLTCIIRVTSQTNNKLDDKGHDDTFVLVNFLIYILLRIYIMGELGVLFLLLTNMSIAQML